MPSSCLSATETSDRDALRRMPRDAVERLQLEKLNALLECVSQRPFYEPRLRSLKLPLRSLDQLDEIPLLTKQQLEPQGHAGADSSMRMPRERGGVAGKVFDLPREQYVRFHQTSGTHGWPMPVLDTPRDWQWWLECWQYVLDAAAVSSADVAMMAFSFGPFIGFWTAHDALVSRGAMVVPGGGMSSESRLRTLADQGCTVLCCTPTYALHLANVAEQLGVSLRENSVRRIIVAGEPGGSIVSVRSRIEQAWGARVIDHSGASEVGAWGFGVPDGPGLHVIESEFIAECLVTEGKGKPLRRADEGELAELVLTSLGRYGGPVLRYRTGDMVRGFRDRSSECRFLWLEGGVLGRSDDMMVIRGVNVFPSSIESIVRELAPSSEFRMLATRCDEMDQLELEVEADGDTTQALAELLRARLSMRVRVRSAAYGTLPRYEAKAKRWVDQREVETK